ncbi:MAG TPA: dTDP-4-dehydrorhamnose 3,5-epimerase [Chitinophagales bacterium]|nr:dTDP-4-dehydrorhamnose 3,5-epimerase [Chitinophagales bacterium]
MQVISTEFKGLFLLEPKVFHDERGFFFESSNTKVLESKGIKYDFVQDNQSFSTYGVLRGMHFQKGEFAQTKLVRVLQGEILDVVVDLRKDSTTYLQTFSKRLSSENKLQLLVPKGFAHGFVVLSETADVLYKCDNYYHPSSEDGLRYDDPKLNIDWILNKEDLIINQKDLKYEFLK